MKESSLKYSILLRMALVAALGVLLLIPIVLVQFIVDDRQSNHAAAVKEVTGKWGGSQLLSGPVLSIPILHKGSDETKTHTELLRILPESLEVRGEVFPEIRTRGIYRVVLYRLRLAIDARFRPLLAAGYDDGKHDILWDKASVTVAITDPKGIRGSIETFVEGRRVDAQPGISERERFAAGFTVDSLRLTPSDNFRFTAQMDLNGSQEFKIVPLGRRTRLELRGDWKDPSFAGDFLPEKREVKDGKFEASWQVLDFNRSLRREWIGGGTDPNVSGFGVKLILPVDEYQKSSRALKYAIMFVALTFLAFLMIDVLTKTPFHPVHYTLVGFALLLFYLLLLSLSEYMFFDASYACAAAAVILLIGGYTRGVTRRWPLAGTMSFLLTVLYALLYVLLQLEDYALLVGSLGLLAILAIVMYITRKIDWFTIGRPQAP